MEHLSTRKTPSLVDYWLPISGSPTSGNYPEYAVIDQLTQYQQPETHTLPSVLRVYRQLLDVLLPLVENNLSKALLADLGELKATTEELRKAIALRPQVSSLLLSDIGKPAFEIVAPISIILEETEGESLARWPEVRASGVGGTAAEAIANLKTEIADLYLDLMDRGSETMGEIALYTLGVLTSHIRRK